MCSVERCAYDSSDCLFISKFTSCEIEKIGRLSACFEALNSKKQVESEAIACLLACYLHDLSPEFACNYIEKALRLRTKQHAFEEEKQDY